MSRKLSAKTACEILQALEGVEVLDHFGSHAFRANERIFATVWFDKNQINFRFSPETQKYFLVKDEIAFNEIDNKWGKLGWTTMSVAEASEKLFREAMMTAYEYSKFSSNPHAKAKKTSSQKTMGRSSKKKLHAVAKTKEKAPATKRKLAKRK